MPLAKAAYQASRAGEEPVDGKGVKAFITDVDGTLYRQEFIRFAMIRRLVRAHLTSPALGLKVLRILKAYRKAQEHLRASVASGNVADSQLRLTCEWTGYEWATVRPCVERWMDLEPLDLLAGALHPYLLEFLDFASQRGVLLGVFSDYCSIKKLQAMRIADYFRVVVSAQDPEVHQFKPSPRGLEVTLKRLGVESSQAVYLGDRPEVDAVAANRAGMQCVIVGRIGNGRHDGWVGMRTYRELKRHFFG